jgi:hypothetical protein
VEFRHLVDNITSLINNIEKLSPAPQAQIALARQEAAAFVTGRSMDPIDNAAKGVDSLL